MGPQVSGQVSATADFYAQLREHYIDCGAPSYRSLVLVSRRLQALYPEALQDRVLPPLSVAVISSVLTGQRTSLPPAEWVTVFILACQRRAFEACILLDDPGPETLPTWMTRYRQARASTLGPQAGQERRSHNTQ